MNNKACPDKKSTPRAEKKRRKITKTYLENAGAHYLQRFAASTSRFRQVMTRKIDLSCRDHPDQDRAASLALLEELIGRFTELGYLNDSAYARALHHSLLSRGTSRTKQRAAMHLRGVRPEDLDDLTSGITADEECRQALLYARRKRLGPWAKADGNDDPKSKEKAFGSLARNGFGYDTANRVLSISLEDAEDLLNGQPE